MNTVPSMPATPGKIQRYLTYYDDAWAFEDEHGHNQALVVYDGVTWAYGAVWIYEATRGTQF